ncbi:MAG TPA: hypothetical protein VMX97_05290 [Hyphomicrobiaceae bacterium]|nr:hypothetical protein [Hyphomicrobiaceae bacterium]
MNDFRCDECGRFISYVDLDQGLATVHMIYPDSAYTVEVYETLCRDHSGVSGQSQRGVGLAGTPAVRELLGQGGVMTENEIDAIRKRLEDCPIPENAEADYVDTSHYEIQNRSDVDDFWWLDVFDVPQDSSTEDGRRLGAVLDYACAYRRDVGVLFERITGLEALRAAAIKMLDDLDNATGPDEWSTSELRAAIAAAGESHP